jgi:hypothetical protein
VDRMSLHPSGPHLPVLFDRGHLSGLLGLWC